MKMSTLNDLDKAHKRLYGYLMRLFYLSIMTYDESVFDYDYLLEVCARNTTKELQNDY